jgi:hypothetical protein
VQVEPQPDGRLVAVKVNDTYWMYWGENDIHVATSDDLYSWVPLMSDDPSHEYRGRPDHQDLPTGATKPISVLTPRRGHFDSNLVEPGPPAILREDGILFIYNSKNVACDQEEDSVCINGESDTNLAPGTYSAGQALFSRTDPTKLLKRSEENFFKPTEAFEITGQVGNVCFLEGMVYFKDKWLLYYGTADSKIAVAETSDYDHAGKLDPRKRGSSSKKPLFQPVRENFSPGKKPSPPSSSSSSSSSSSTTGAKKSAANTATATKQQQQPAAALHPADISDVTTPPANPDSTTPAISTKSVASEKKKQQKEQQKEKQKEEQVYKKKKEEDRSNLRSENTGAAKKSPAAAEEEEKRGGEDKFML